MKQFLLALMLMLPFASQAQHVFEYVCETEAVEFYLDSYIGTPINGICTVWEKRIFTKTPAGQAEAARTAALYPDLKLESITSYYVKQKFDLENLRSQTLAVYFFNSKNDEVGSKRFGAEAKWEDISPETVADMEITLVRKWAEEKTKNNQ